MIMSTLQLIFFVVLPLIIGIAGVAYGEAFRVRAKATLNEPPLDEQIQVKQTGR
jgi:hypothetical protein